MSISRVGFCSLYVPEACPLCPVTLIIPCAVSMSLLVRLWSSSGLMPVSARIVNTVAYLRLALLMILVTCSLDGIMGVLTSHLYRGFVHCMLLALARWLYAKASFVFDALLIGCPLSFFLAFAM